jgi:hypothetical protein
MEHVKILREAMDSSKETGAMFIDADKQVEETLGFVEEKEVLAPCWKRHCTLNEPCGAIT